MVSWYLILNDTGGVHGMVNYDMDSVTRVAELYVPSTRVEGPVRLLPFTLIPV